MANNIENAIDYYRKLAGLTIDELAAKSGVSPGYIKQIKSKKSYGDRKPRRLNEDIATRIAKALGNCSAGDLLGSHEAKFMADAPAPAYEHERNHARAEITIDGDSMAPTLREGDIITIDPAQKELKDGIYALRFDGQVIVRRVQRNPITGRVSLISDNKAYEPLHDIDPATLDVVGRAVKQIRNL